VPSVTSQPFVVGTVLNENSPPAHLSVRNLEVVYNDVALVLRGVTLEVPRGGIAALLGANGAGKTTLLRAITGLLRIHRGAITKGDVLLDGDSITGHDPAQIVRHGISHVMEGRRIFAELTVEENLRAGAYTKRDRNEVKRNHERVMELFPVLADRRRSVAGYLSGGEQQMLAMGRALMQSPELLLLDEPSLGLAPRLVENIRDLIVDINRSGTSVLLVEQNAAMALSISTVGYVMETGRVVRDGPAAELREDKDIKEFYLGMGGDERRSFRDVKSYRRKKRWSA
jgi:branched-chain amino acid transport system ATP-binding protein